MASNYGNEYSCLSTNQSGEGPQARPWRWQLRTKSLGQTALVTGDTGRYRVNTEIVCGGALFEYLSAPRVIRLWHQGSVIPQLARLPTPPINPPMGNPGAHGQNFNLYTCMCVLLCVVAFFVNAFKHISEFTYAAACIDITEHATCSNH